MGKSCHTAGICSGSLHRQDKKHGQINSSDNTAELATKVYHMVNCSKMDNFYLRSILVNESC